MKLKTLFLMGVWPIFPGYTSITIYSCGIISLQRRKLWSAVQNYWWAKCGTRKFFDFECPRNNEKFLNNVRRKIRLQLIGLLYCLQHNNIFWSLFMNFQIWRMGYIRSYLSYCTEYINSLTIVRYCRDVVPSTKQVK